MVVQKAIKSFIKYALFMGIAVLLLWLSLRALRLENGDKDEADIIWDAWERSDKMFLALMAMTVTVSHVIRARRWKTLLEPSGNKTTAFRSFISIAIGYLINLAVPRGGEISRCYNLMKLDKVPVQISIGTVLTERIVDVILMLAVVGIAFLLEWGKLLGFMSKLPVDSPAYQTIWIWTGAIAATLAIVFFLWKKALSKSAKIRRLFIGFKEGLTSVFRLKHKRQFIIDSLSIWALYFIMTYFVILSFPETKHLGVDAVLTMFALGSIAMAVPLPGGTGAYHTIVPLGLVYFYQIPQNEAIAFVFVFHAWQTLIMIVTGVLAFVATYLLIKNETPHGR